MSSISQAFAQAVAKADFSSINQLIVNTILQKQGHALAKDLAQLSSQRSYVSRLLPLLQQPWNQEQFIAAGLDRVNRQLEQLIVPAAISAMARFSLGWYVIQGCRPSPGPVEVVVLTIDGHWISHKIQEGCFRYQSSRHAEGFLGYNYSFIGVIELPKSSAGIKEVWINGFKTTFAIQDLSDCHYVDQIDDLLFLFQQAQVPLDRLPDLISHGLFELAKVLRDPLKCQSQWPNYIRRQTYYGSIKSQSAHTTIVIPLYRLWHAFLQGHSAAFSIDPDFLDGQIEVMYVIDDPAIESQVLNWARIYLHDCTYPVRIISLDHNYGFGMACNIGIQAAHTQYVVLMNSDVMPIKPGWIQSMKNVWDDYPTALLSPVLLYDNHTVQHVGMNLAFSGTPLSPIPCNMHIHKGVFFGQLEDVTEVTVWNVFALTGALLAFNRDLFLQLGGFEPIFGRGDFEDMDFCLRWKESIGPILMTRAAQLIHLERQTMNIVASENRQWQERFNACCLLHLNHQVQQLAEEAWF